MGTKDVSPRGIPQEATLSGEDSVDFHINSQLEQLPHPFTQDLLHAYSLYKTDKDYPDERARNGITLSKGLLDVGIDPTPLFPEIDSAISKTGDHKKIELLYSKAHLLIQAGKIDQARQIALELSEIDSIASLKAFHLFNAIAEHVDDKSAREAFHQAQKCTEDDPGLVTIIGEREYKRGFSPDETFRQAQLLIEQTEGIHDKSYVYLSLSQAYASTGQFEKALDLVPLIKNDPPEKTRIAQLEALRSIGRMQAEQGQIENAIQTANLTEDPYSKADIVVKTAKAQAKMEGNVALPLALYAHRLIDDVARNGNNQEFNRDVYMYNSDRIARLYAHLGNAVGNTGLNPNIYFDKAIKTLLDGPDPANDHSIRVLLEIAKAQKAFEIDATSTIDQALRLADAISDQPDYDEFDAVSQTLSYLDIGRATVDVTYFERLEGIFERLDREEYNYTDDRIALLTRRARVKMESSYDKQH